MTNLNTVVVDYGAGNVATVQRTLQALGYRNRVSQDPAHLRQADLVVLPGVGAYASAMQALQGLGLTSALQEHARAGKPLLGICLGMQLLADESSEFGTTKGLGLVPGRVQALGAGRWHIGWNNLQVLDNNVLLAPAQGQSLYFNHSFVFDAASAHRVAEVQLENGQKPVTAAVQKDNVVGLQFHPEKSQAAGRLLLQQVIEGLRLA